MFSCVIHNGQPRLVQRQSWAAWSELYRERFPGKKLADSSDSWGVTLINPPNICFLSPQSWGWTWIGRTSAPIFSPSFEPFKNIARSPNSLYWLLENAFPWLSIHTGNQTWQWKMDHLSVIFLSKTSVYSGFSIAMLDYHRVIHN